MNTLLIILYIFLLIDLIDRIVTYFGLRLGYEEGNIIVGNDRLSWLKTYLIIIILIEFVFIIHHVNGIISIYIIVLVTGEKLGAISGWLQTFRHDIMRKIERLRKQEKEKQGMRGNDGMGGE